MRVGIEKEIWCLERLNNGYFSRPIRDLTDFTEFLFSRKGDFEYQQNVIELRSRGNGERDPTQAETDLIDDISGVSSILLKNYSRSLLIGSGTYLGNDEPPLDISQNEERFGRNDFWSQFNLVFPADASTRWTAADQVCLSFTDGTEQRTIDFYNKLVGLSPFFIYVFSTSSLIGNVPLKVWNRRQQIINSKGMRADIILPGTYPLSNLYQYKSSLDDKVQDMGSILAKANRLFFCNSGKTPFQVISDYRSSDWGFVKLATDQVVRFNQKDGWENAYLELRCVDSQECPKMTAALAWFGRRLAEVDIIRLWNLMPLSERELREGVNQATLYGNNGFVVLAGEEISLPEYARKIYDLVIGQDDSRYANLIKQRVNSPPASLLRKLCEDGRSVPEILSRCLIENKTICELENE